MLSVYNVSEWSNILNDIYKTLKVNSYFELVEYDFVIKHDDLLNNKYTKKINNYFIDNFKKNNYIHDINLKSFIGSVILNNMTFFWDDIKDDLVLNKKSIILNEIHEICKEYYEIEYVEKVFEASEQWINHDTFFRTHKSKKLICNNLHTYWQYRLIDSGTHYWLKITSPIYKNEEYSKLVDIMILSQLVLKPFMVVNDICSYYKEKYFNEYSNFLNVTNNINKQIEDIEHDIECIKSFDNDISNILLDKIYGHYIWAINTNRYKNNITDINCRLDIL
jgi:hypothetical protein